MTYREHLVQKLIDNGATKQQTESKILDIMIATLALEKNPSLDEFVEIIKEDKEICEETKRRLRNRETELWDEENAYKLISRNPKNWVLRDQDRISGEVVSETYECPKKLISLRTATSSRVMTEEQRQAAAERLRKARRINEM